MSSPGSIWPHPATGEFVKAPGLQILCREVSRKKRISNWVALEIQEFFQSIFVWDLFEMVPSHWLPQSGHWRWKPGDLQIYV